MERGKFIDFEGVGRSGKTTQIDFAGKLLEANGYKVIKTREPGGIESAERIRKLIFDLKGKGLIEFEGQMALFSAARMLWREELITPNLDRGVNILTDRCFPSTAAYQGYAEGGDLNIIEKVSDIVMGEYKPDAVLFIDISFDNFMERTNTSGSDGDPFDAEEIDYTKKVIAGYRETANEGWGGLKWFMVNGDQDVQAVNKDVKEILEEIFQTRLDYNI